MIATRRSPTPPPETGEARTERPLIAALQAGDPRAFATLVERYHDRLVGVARCFVRDRGIAEEVAQDAWLAVIQGIGRFEGRSPLRPWLFRIAVNRAKERRTRELRVVPVSSLLPMAAPTGDWPAAVRGLAASQRQACPEWSATPAAAPDEAVIARETLAQLSRALDELLPGRRRVIALRDLAGWSAAEVCTALGLRDGNQRVLLHRARAHVRRSADLTTR
jgi:RNA polymerase sigma-70 factor, ECF subfamily